MVDRILEGVRIIDWTVYQVGPCATALLADLGAEVIHVEEPEHGDLQRGLMTYCGVELVRPGGREIHFEEHNRNKKSIAIDLKKSGGREVMYRLVAESDVFVTNFRKAAIDKLGMDYQTIKGYNPSLIYARSSGFGDRGPLTKIASLDPIGGARSGFSMGGGELGGPPVFVSPGVGDRVVSLYLVYGILAALYAKSRWGIGQEVSTSQLGSLIAIQGDAVTVTLNQKTPNEFPRRRGGATPTQGFYKCKDNKWIVVYFAEQVGPRWTEFWKALGVPDLGEDSRFASFQARAEHAEELFKLLEIVFIGKTRKEWEEIFHKTDVMATACLELSEVQYDPQVLANDYITEWEHPVLGRIKFVGFPVQFSETPPAFRMAAPELGQHTEEVLTEVCGYTWDEISKLNESGVIP